MPGQRPILAMSFVASLGITFDVLACAVPKGEANFWPMLVILFYLLVPLPMLFARRIIKETNVGLDKDSSSKVRDYALFVSAGIMVSNMALPIVLARSPPEKPVIAPISCFLVELGNVLCYATMGLFSIYFKMLD